jgi:hypothetical protein
MTVKQSVINTFNRVGIDYLPYLSDTSQVEVYNRFGGGKCTTTPLIALLIDWVYKISNDYELGNMNVNVSDFDRIRYFILDQDSNAYYTCID